MIDPSNYLKYTLYLATRPALKRKVSECSNPIEPIGTVDMDKFSVENWRWILTAVKKYTIDTMLTGISQDTIYSSMISDKISHPLFKILVSTPESIQYLIESIDKDPEGLTAMVALSVITCENPVPDESRGNIPEMARCWKEWYKKYTP